jgi:hypothetical protein
LKPACSFCEALSATAKASPNPMPDIKQRPNITSLYRL